MKLTLRKWLFWCGLLGLVVPVVLILRWKLCESGGGGIDCVWGQREATVWPSSIMLMALEGKATLFDIVLFYGIAIGVNILLYSGIGLLVWPVVRVLTRRAVRQKSG